MKSTINSPQSGPSDGGVSGCEEILGPWPLASFLFPIVLPPEIVLKPRALRESVEIC